MKKAAKIVIFSLLAIIGLVITAGLYTSYFLPSIQTENVQVELTPGRIERGKYLASHVTVCIDCHSSRDWARFSGPVIRGSEGGGGEKFDQAMGFPGEFYSPNITPAALSSWTDGELLRAITSGVNKDNRALFPVMPYHNYAQLAREDVYSIIAYLRTLPAVNTVVPESRADFPMNILLNTLPAEASLIDFKTLKKEDYGRYLVTAAGCVDCHTPFKDGKLVMEKELAGGRTFPLSGSKVSSPNITPDLETGIGSWSKEKFIRRFKMYAPENYTPHQIEPGDFNTVMPWVMYAGMKEEDLGAIYDYLRTVKPIRNYRR